MPVIRGVVNFVETMALSMRTLNRSADMLGIEEEESKFEKWLAEKLGKKQGKYITLRGEYAVNRDQSHHLEVGRAFAGELKKLLPNKKELVLVVGLGNRKMTPDALGPKTADCIMVTRHLVEMIPGQLDSRVRPVCVFTPGVLGDTGMESAQSITAVAAEI